MKKIILGIVIIAIIGVGSYYIFSNKNNPNNNKGNIVDNKDTDIKDDNNSSTNKKILVVYYSAQSHTKTIAQKIANNLNADIFEIEPIEPYTSADLNYNNSDSRVSKEHNDESLRNVELKNIKVDNWDEYDTILIGYPIWWGIAAWPVNNFVKGNDFTGKTVIPFCTSASSGLGNSGKNLETMANGGTWLEGHRFSSNESDENITNWTKTLS